MSEKAAAAASTCSIDKTMQGLRRAAPYGPDSLVAPVSAYVAATDAATADIVLQTLEREGLSLRASWGRLAELDSPRWLHLDLLVVVEPETAGYPESDYETVRARAPNAAILIVCSANRARPQRLLHSGADAIVFEPGADAALGPTARAALAGYVVVPRSLRAAVQPPPFTRREREIVQLVVEGLTNREIAQRLYLAESTVKRHVSSMFRRLGVSSRAEAVATLLASDGSFVRDESPPG